MNKIYIYFLCINASLSLFALNEETSMPVTTMSRVASVKNKLRALAKKPTVRYTAAASVCFSLASYMTWKNMHVAHAEQHLILVQKHDSTNNIIVPVGVHSEKQEVHIVDVISEQECPDPINRQKMIASVAFVGFTGLIFIYDFYLKR